MPSPINFPHLPFPKMIRGNAKLTGNATRKDQTVLNKQPQNRVAHSQKLLDSSEQAIRNWQSRRGDLSSESQQIFPAGVSLLLQVEDTTDLRFLSTAFGFEIVSEDEDGFVVVTTEDIELSLFKKTVEGFATEASGSGNAARVYELKSEPERVNKILSESLRDIWPTINEDALYHADLGITCLGMFHIPDAPERKSNEAEDKFEVRMQRWRAKRAAAYEELAQTRRDRIALLYKLVEGEIYRGRVTNIIEDGSASLNEEEPDEPDYAASFTARIHITGGGLKDIVLNNRFVLDAQLVEAVQPLQVSDVASDTIEERLILLPPAEDAPTVCVIDSGIQEGHRLIAPAMDAAMSFCFIPHKPVVEVADYCRGGGHGTRVAGAVLFRDAIPSVGTHPLPFWIQNARVLNEDNNLHVELFEPWMLLQVVRRYLRSPKKTRLYNQSINHRVSYSGRHMSSWATMMDTLSFNEDVLFIQSAGNIPEVCIVQEHENDQRYWGVTEHLRVGEYPVYLRSPFCRIANPAQSMQSITVGSVIHTNFIDGDYTSLGGADKPASYSRTGLGIWGSIKPDVVEYGGDFVRDSGEPPSISIRDQFTPELVRATLFGGAERGRDDVGTSFAAPKVAHIAAHLQAVLPNEPTLLYRALIAQSARWPTWAETANEPMEVLQHIGYGIPSLERATENSVYRVTLITNELQFIHAGEAHIFQIKVPEELRLPQRKSNIRIEVTLSYASAPRRSRRRLRGYMATRVEWLASRRGESMESFEGRIFSEQPEVESSGRNFGWFLQDKTNAGALRGTSRNYSTLQKDWATVKSNQLPEVFAIAVRGRRGWSEDPDALAKYSLAVTFEAIDEDLEVYEPVRVMIHSQIEAELEQSILSEVQEELAVELTA